MVLVLGGFLESEWFQPFTVGKIGLDDKNRNKNIASDAWSGRK